MTDETISLRRGAISVQKSRIGTHGRIQWIRNYSPDSLNEDPASSRGTAYPQRGGRRE